MRLIILCLILVSCTQKEKLKTYITVVHTKELSMYGDYLRTVAKTDTIQTKNDSLAYIDGAMNFLAHKRTYEGLLKHGVKITDPQSFEVLDEDGLNVDVSEDFIKQVDFYIYSDGKEKTPLVDSLLSVLVNSKS